MAALGGPPGVEAQWCSQDTRIFNIIMIGDSRSGKTTFLNILKNLSYRPDQIKTSAQTKEPEVHEFIITHMIEPITLKVIDTPGFSEVGDSKMSTRSNEVIASIIQNMTKSTSTKINMILMFTNAAYGITQNQLQTFQYLIGEIGYDYTGVMGMMVSQADNFDQEQEEKWIKDFKENEEFSIISECCEAGIFFTGACPVGLAESAFISYKIKQTRRMNSWLKSMMDLDSVSTVSDQADQSESSSLLKATFSFVEDLNNVESFSNKAKQLISDCQDLKTQIEAFWVKHTEELKDIIDQKEYQGLRNILETNSSNFNKDDDRKIILEAKALLEKEKEISVEISLMKQRYKIYLGELTGALKGLSLFNHKMNKEVREKRKKK